MTDYPDLCNNEPSCQKPELLKRIRELECVIYRNADPMAATERDRIIIERIAHRIFEEALADD